MRVSTRGTRRDGARAATIRFLLLLALSLMSLWTSGCGKDPGTSLRSLHSWSVFSAMAGRAWVNGATPRRYTTQALERAHRQLAAEQREVGTMPAGLRTAAAPVAEHVLGRVTEMRDAVRAGDRDRVGAAADGLFGDARRLQDLARIGADGS